MVKKNMRGNKSVWILSQKSGIFQLEITMSGNGATYDMTTTHCTIMKHFTASTSVIRNVQQNETTI